MRLMIRIFMLAAVAATATAAFASDAIIVNVPFSFETHGKAFPAGKYQVEYEPAQYTLMLFSKTNPSKPFMWAAFPAEYTPKMAKLALKREKHVAQPVVSITGGR